MTYIKRDNWKLKQHHSQESKLKISKSNKKTWSNPELRKYLSEKSKGQRRSVATEFKKGHILGFKKGYIPWNKGLKYKLIKNKEDRENNCMIRTKDKSYNREYYKKQRLEVIKKLGEKCCKCGFNDKRALQIDHINGGGIKERKRKDYYSIYTEIMTTNQKKYQLLCANCNWIKKYENNENPYRNI